MIIFACLVAIGCALALMVVSWGCFTLIATRSKLTRGIQRAVFIFHDLKCAKCEESHCYQCPTKPYLVAINDLGHLIGAWCGGSEAYKAACKQRHVCDTCGLEMNQGPVEACWMPGCEGTMVHKPEVPGLTLASPSCSRYFEETEVASINEPFETS